MPSVRLPNLFPVADTAGTDRSPPKGGGTNHDEGNARQSTQGEVASIPVTRLNHAVLHVRDLNRSVESGGPSGSRRWQTLRKRLPEPLAALRSRQMDLAGAEGFEPPTCGFGDRLESAASVRRCPFQI